MPSYWIVGEHIGYKEIVRLRCSFSICDNIYILSMSTDGVFVRESIQRVYKRSLENLMTKDFCKNKKNVAVIVYGRSHTGNLIFQVYFGCLVCFCFGTFMMKKRAYNDSTVNK